jgi:hypothetical protein
VDPLPADEVALLLRERAGHRSGPAVAVVPGPVASEFAAAYPTAEPMLWDARGGPLDRVDFYGDLPPGPRTDRWELLDDPVQRAFAFRLATARAVLIHVQDVPPLAWERDEATGVWRADVDHRFDDTERSYRLQGAFAAIDHDVLCERGYHRPGAVEPATVSWLVVFVQSGSVELAGRLSGIEVDMFARLFGMP